MKKKLIILFLLTFLAGGVSAVPQKFRLWQTPGYFRGFNADYWSSHDNYAKTLKDMVAMRQTGANLIKINIYAGTVAWKSPYGTIEEGEESLRTMIDMVRQAGLYYVIDVRAGPGRKDVSEDHQSTTWTNKDEQELYAQMLKGYVATYGDDPLFVGLNLMVEPNPLWKEIESDEIVNPQQLKTALEKRKIDIAGMFAYFIDEIRTVNKELPLIVQNIQYSDPQWWVLMEKQQDPYIVYDVHSYAPYEYSHARSRSKATYPGRYWCTSLGDYATFDKQLLDDVIFRDVKVFQKTHQVPILLGEFGMRYPQRGGVEYLSDYADIARNEGWHFCLWSFRPDDPDRKRHVEFDSEKWDEAYWQAVSSWYK